MTKWDHLNSENSICFYHGNCLDGVSSAWIVSKAIKGIPLVPIIHGVERPNFLELTKDKNVFFVDLAPSREEYLLIKEIATDVIVLDHHETSHLAIGDLVKIDQSRSGVMLTWMYFNSNPNDPKPVPEELLAIEDRDLWLFKRRYTKEFAEYAFFNGLEVEDFDRLMQKGFYNCVNYGRLLVEAKRKEIERVVQNGREIDFHGFRGLLVNARPEVTSDLGSYIYTELGYDVAIIYQDRKDKRAFGLRSKAGGPVNVEHIARTYYGGGGHKAAAGFSLPYGVELDDY